MLWKIGSELNADRISIFERGEEQGSVSNTYEWCRNGVEPMKAKMQRVPLTPCFLYDTFREQHIVRIPDYEAYLAANPHLEHYLPDIRRFIAVPLKISDKIIGHVQIVNPKEQVFQASSYLMMTLSRFIAIMIRNRDATRELERMSQRDQMTGLLNRRGLSSYFMDLPEGIPCAFFFGDVNGLKRMNDEHGHEAGDALIKTVADIMLQAQRRAGKGHVFRMGGDEFLMIVEQLDETHVEGVQQALREGDMNYILEQAVSQSEAGAQVLDVNVGAPGVDEPAVMEQVVKALQSVVSLPLQLDSSHADALERGLRVYNGKPIVNSVNGETEVLERVLPLCKKYGAAVVGLAIDERGIQPSAAQAAFEEIKTAIAKRGGAGASKGRIVLATVKGDVHDIGKNIVRVILENYGFEVIDLGRDVPVETVVDTVREKDVHLVGLSALMTTTLKSMEETIAALHAAKLDCKVMVGGAVLTPEYAEKIGADWYAKDAKQSADIAKKFFGES